MPTLNSLVQERLSFARGSSAFSSNSLGSSSSSSAESSSLILPTSDASCSTTDSLYTFFMIKNGRSERLREDIYQYFQLNLITLLSILLKPPPKTTNFGAGVLYWKKHIRLDPACINEITQWWLWAEWNLIDIYILFRRFLLNWHD